MLLFFALSPVLIYLYHYHFDVLQAYNIARPCKAASWEVDVVLQSHERHILLFGRDVAPLHFR
jgi:hypothetical protein